MTTSTSQINYNTINAAYPVAGQDNDSQGFRDNFSAIKIALSTASNEITNLQLYTAKLASVDGVGVDNDFNGGTIQNAVLTNNFTKKWPTDVGPKELNPNEETGYSVDGTYKFHAYAISTNTSFQLAWPDIQAYPAGDGNLAELRMHVSYSREDIAIPGIYATSRSDSTVHIVSSNNSGAVWTDTANLTLPMRMNSNSSTYVFDAWTYDAGLTTFVKFVGAFTEDGNT